MKLVGVISTAVLSLTLGIAAPAYAQQEQHEQQEEQKAKPDQDEKTAQPAKPAEDKAAKQEDKNAQPEEKSARQDNKAKPENSAKQEDKAAPAEQKAQPQQRAGNNGGGRIPADKFKANFGQRHSFRVSQADYRNHSFQYGGYSFGFVDAWPSNWLYTQDVYVIEINGVYYLCNASFPGVNLTLSFTL